MQCVNLELQKITELSLHHTLRSYKSCIFQNDLSQEFEFYLDTSQNKLDKDTLTATDSPVLVSHHCYPLEVCKTFHSSEVLPQKNSDEEQGGDEQQFMVLPGSKFPVVWDMAWVQVASCTPARTFRKLLYSLYYGLQREPWISVLPVQVLTRSGVEDLVPTNLSEKGLPLLFNVRRVLVRHICPFCILAFFAK